MIEFFKIMFVWRENKIKIEKTISPFVSLFGDLNRVSHTTYSHVH
jgi:hypothetical protein